MGCKHNPKGQPARQSASHSARRRSAENLSRSTPTKKTPQLNEVASTIDIGVRDSRDGIQSQSVVRRCELHIIFICLVLRQNGNLPNEVNKIKPSARMQIATAADAAAASCLDNDDVLQNKRTTTETLSRGSRVGSGLCLASSRPSARNCVVQVN